MRRINLLLLTLTATSISGCWSARQEVLPEMGSAHQIADPARVVILVEDPTMPGVYVRTSVTYPAGAWIRLRTDTPLPVNIAPSH